MDGVSDLSEDCCFAFETAEGGELAVFELGQSSCFRVLPDHFKAF